AVAPARARIRSIRASSVETRSTRHDESVAARRSYIADPAAGVKAQALRAPAGRPFSRMDLAARAHELLGLGAQALLESLALGDAALARDATDVVGDLHRAEVRAAH